MITKIIETDNGSLVVEIDYGGIINTFDEDFFVRLCHNMTKIEKSHNEERTLRYQMALNKLYIYKALKQKNAYNN